MSSPSGMHAQGALPGRYAAAIEAEGDDQLTTPHSAISKRRRWGGASLRLALAALALDGVVLAGVLVELLPNPPLQGIISPLIRLAALLALVLAIRGIAFGHRARARARRFPYGGPARGARPGLAVAYPVALVNFLMLLAAFAFATQGAAR
jgi:hypothetical protein